MGSSQAKEAKDAWLGIPSVLAKKIMIGTHLGCDIESPRRGGHLTRLAHGAGIWPSGPFKQL